MRLDLRMGYRLAKQVPIQSNEERCLVLRQQYALKMLPLLESGKRIINVDESWINQTKFLRRIWAPTDAAGTYSFKQVAPRISLIVALDTEGRIWFALTQANTDTDIMTTFLNYLKRELDLQEPGWEETSTILLDNAKWHSNVEMKERLAKMQLPVIYSAPYSYTTAPVEKIFAALKLGELNPEKLPTGKKSLSHVTDLVARRLS